MLPVYNTDLVKLIIDEVLTVSRLELALISGV